MIELLIVISIIAVLAAVALPSLTSAIKKARFVETKASLVWLRTAISSYESEYSRLPTTRSGDEDITIITDGSDPLIYVLLGQTKDGLNSHRVNYFESRIATGRRNGVSLDDNTAALYDSWGHPLHVLLDVNGDHLLANPDADNEDAGISSGATPKLPLSVAVYSDGPDGKPHTLDDVVSWR